MVVESDEEATEDDVDPFKDVYRTMISCSIHTYSIVNTTNGCTCIIIIFTTSMIVPLIFINLALVFNTPIRINKYIIL